MVDSEYQSILEMSSGETLNGWLFNARQHNWQQCVAGPSKDGGHGTENVDNPWHGIKKTTKSDALPSDIESGDIVFARRATRTKGGRSGTEPHGVLGIWRFYDYRRVTPDLNIPWDGGTKHYRYVLYCREDPDAEKEFTDPITENFSSGSVPFDQTQLNTSVYRLSGFERRPYVNHLLDQRPTDAGTRKVLQELLSQWE